jgi:hypothetical protein
MRNNLFSPAGIFLAGALLASSACSFKLVVPPGQVICQQPADCPTGYVCERIEQAPIVVSVCCLKAGCTKNLPDAAVENAAIAAGYSPPDAAADEGASSEVGVSSDAPRSRNAGVSPDS